MTQRDNSNSGRREGVLFWTAVIALSGAGSIAAVRLASPVTLDERVTALVLFFFLPALLILLAGAIHRMAGLALAALQPFVWLGIARTGSDSLLIWLIPPLAALLMLLVHRRTAGRRVSLWPAMVSAALGLTVLLLPGPGRPAEGSRVLLVGVDGATWKRIDPLIEQGRLPNFARLVEDGHRATLRSLPSLFSPQVWSTIATGCPVSVHGIEDFANQQSEFRVGRIWDEMKREGRSFGVFGWYFSWPPLSGLGGSDFVIPSTLAPDDQTYPAEYSFFRRVWARERKNREEAISYAEAGLQAFRHGIRLSTLRWVVFGLMDRGLRQRTGLDTYWRTRKMYTAFQGDLFAELVRTRRPEFAAILFKPVDSVSHIYWKFVESEGFPEVTGEDIDRYGGAIDELYAEIDRNLAKILASAPEDVDILIVSDHGFQPLDKRKIADWFCRVRTENLIHALGLDDSLFGTNVDLTVFLRPLTPTPEAKDNLLTRVEEILSGAHLSEDIVPLFEVRREGGVLTMNIAERSAINPDARVVLDGEEYPFDDIIMARQDVVRSGGHHPDGIYLLAGPSVSRSTSADSLHVFDVAPTVGALLGLPVSPQWPGRAALEGVSAAEMGVAAYAPPFEPAAPEVRIHEELKDKLRAIGYLE